MLAMKLFEDPNTQYGMCVREEQKRENKAFHENFRKIMGLFSSLENEFQLDVNRFFELRKLNPRHDLQVSIDYERVFCD